MKLTILFLDGNNNNCNICSKSNYSQSHFKHDTKNVWFVNKPSINHLHIFYCVSFVYMAQKQGQN
jgi:hypothetical protein